MAQDGQTSINIPQLIAVAVVGFFAIRWFMSKPGSPSSSTGASSSSGRRGNASSGNNAIDVAKIERVASVFPQLDRRSIAWDLQRNGGNVEATTERVLGGRALDTPPPTFQPNIPSPATGPANSSAVSSGVRKGGAGAGNPDLITRYGLQARVGGKGKEPVPSEEQKRNNNSWSADKGTRADALKRRREEMILAARRKMQEKDGEARVSDGSAA